MKEIKQLDLKLLSDNDLHELSLNSKDSTSPFDGA